MGFGSSADVEILLDDIDNRKMADVRLEDGRKDKFPLYYDGESISGKVNTFFRVKGKLEIKIVDHLCLIL